MINLKKKSTKKLQSKTREEEGDDVPDNLDALSKTSKKIKRDRSRGSKKSHRRVPEKEPDSAAPKSGRKKKDDVKSKATNQLARLKRIEVYLQERFNWDNLPVNKPEKKIDEKKMSS